MGFNLETNSNPFVVDWLEQNIEVNFEAEFSSNRKSSESD